MSDRNKPDWRKGDVLVGAEGRGINAAFVAEHDPTQQEAGGDWYYVFCPAWNYRKATPEDMRQKVEWQEQFVARAQAELDRLQGLAAKVKAAAAGGAGEGRGG